MVVPALASAQEQGSTDTDSTLTDEVQADDTITEEPAPPPPPAEPPAEPVVETTPPAPVEETEPAPVEETAGFEGSTDTSKASTEPAAPREPATAPAAAPETESADVAAVKAEATDSPGNSGGGGKAAAGRALADGGGKLEATKASSESKPGCLARGGVDANEIHNTFPTDGSCAVSVGDNGLPTAPSVGCTADDPNPQPCYELQLAGPNGTATFDLWLSDGPDQNDELDTVNFTLLSGGPLAASFFVKGGSPGNDGGHFLCDFANLANGGTGSCSTFPNPNGNPGTPPKLFGFSHVDVCVRAVNTPPPPPPPPPPGIVPEEELPPDREDQLPDELLEDLEEQRQEQLDEFEEAAAVPPAVIPTAVAAAPDEALPFTGLDTGWLVLMSIALLGSGIVLRRTVS